MWLTRIRSVGWDSLYPQAIGRVIEQLFIEASGEDSNKSRPAWNLLMSARSSQTKSEMKSATKCVVFQLSNSN